jgi:hypothetical protein
MKMKNEDMIFCPQILMIQEEIYGGKNGKGIIHWIHPHLALFFLFRHRPQYVDAFIAALFTAK